MSPFSYFLLPMLEKKMLEKATLIVFDNSLLWAEVRQMVSSLFFTFITLEPDQQRRVRAQRFRFSTSGLFVSVVHCERTWLQRQ